MADRILAACTLLLAAVYLYATAALPSLDIGDPLGPKAFPVLLGILLLVAGILLLLEKRRGRGTPGSPAAAATASRPRSVAGVAIVTAVFFVLLEPLGYLIGMTLYLFVVTLWLHGRKPVSCFVIAVLFAVVSYALFVKGLGVGLPKGLFYF